MRRGILWGPGGPRQGLTGCCLLPVLPDGDLTDTVSGPRSTASDLTSGKASARSPTQRHNPFNEDQAEPVSSSDTTPVHATFQEKAESRTPEPPDACVELEVIRSEGAGAGGGWVGFLVPVLSTASIMFCPLRQLGIFPGTECPPFPGSALSGRSRGPGGERGAAAAPALGLLGRLSGPSRTGSTCKAPANRTSFHGGSRMLVHSF